MTALRYIKFSPAGNTTAFVVDDVPGTVRPALARGLMGVLDVEQVGFVVPSENGSPRAPSERMEMMGGEFCGNASRCFASFLALGGEDIWERGPRPLEAALEVSIEVSGHSGLLRAAVTPRGNDLGCHVAVAMPVPCGITAGSDAAAGQYSLVSFEGIRHLVLWDLEAEQMTVGQTLAEDLSLTAGDYGLMFMGGGSTHMTPFVSIAATGTEVWESSCGSGTVAVACALAHREGRSVEALALAQPGGTLTASAVWDGSTVLDAALSGEIALVSWGYV